MCWNEKVSLSAFAIGTAANIYIATTYKHPMILATCVLWEFVLLMQIFEAGAWITHKKNVAKNNLNCSKENTFFAKGAYIANVCQPIVLAIVVLALNNSNISQENKLLGGGIIMIYIGWLLYATNKIDEVKCLRPSNECSNLVYEWWSKFPLGAAIYMITLVGLIIVLVRPMNFALMQLSYILLTFAVSAYFYKCGIGSVWCYLAAAAPLLIKPMWDASQ